jgi:hypothetical protein
MSTHTLGRKEQTTTAMAEEKMRPGTNVAPSHVEEAIPVDLVDPHRAALEYNPDHAETPSLSTILAVIVSRGQGRGEHLLSCFLVVSLRSVL